MACTADRRLLGEAVSPEQTSGQGDACLKSCSVQFVLGIEAGAILDPFLLTSDMSGAILARGCEKSRAVGFAEAAGSAGIDSFELSAL